MKIVKRFKLSEFSNNAYLIKTDHKYVLIDAPKNIKQVIDFMSEKPIILDEVWLTHGHLDHILGLNLLKETFPKLRVYISEEEININSNKINLVNLFPNEKFEYKEEVLDNEVLKIYDTNLEIKNISGHSKNSSVYIFKKEKIMFTGDVLFKNSIGRSDLSYGNEIKLKKGIKEKLLGFEDYEVYPGHGFCTTIKDEIKENKFLNE